MLTNTLGKWTPVSKRETRVNRSTGKAPTKKEFLSISYRNPINQYKRPNFKFDENVRILKKDIPFGKR